ncbi:DUF4738 domain-containing protein [uncultured Bacteroides sp.]|uniref:DUF4738 domain-containing protein n=1 Tax=uncultured Bacteroides sp. TaxID=162156 RepID=UPI002AAA7554|nr:DUF4738 domain-containing protein [uncultured Bacteroides sp.]
MKKITYLLFLIAFGAFTACSGKKGNNSSERLALTEDTVIKPSLQRMQKSKSEKDIKYKGKDYHIFLSRTPNDSLPHVLSETAGTYVDNQIVLKITRGNDRVFSKTFTKKNFISVVDEKFYENSILEGMVFDKTTSEGMIFATSLSYPQTDLYMPVAVTITADGKMSMKKDEPMDNSVTE